MPTHSSTLMARLIRTLFLVLPCIAISCKARFQADDASAMKGYITEPTNGLLQSKQQGQLALTLQYLPAAYLENIQQLHNPAAEAKEGDELATFQLVLKSRQESSSLAHELQKLVPAGWSFAQQEHALFYGFEEISVLHLGKKIIKPLYATVEMTAQTQRELSVVLVFPLTVSQMRTQPAIHVILSPSYFLERPVTFSFETASLLAVSR